MTLAQKKIVGKMHIPEKFFKNNIFNRLWLQQRNPEIATVFN